MRFIKGAVLVAFLSCWIAACGTGRPAWVALTPKGHRAAADAMQAEDAGKRLTIRAAMQEGKRRYIARFEIVNRTKRAITAPDDVVLTDGKGLIQNVISADQLKQEIQNSAADAAYYSLQPSVGYYYRPRWRHGYHYYAGGPLIYDDWFANRIEANRIIAQANQKMAALDSDYLRGQEIPPGATLRGFLVFSKSSAVPPLRLTVKAGNASFPFEFSPAGL